jgi:polyphosphate kinase
LDAERKIQAAQRANENRNAAKAETDILRKAEDARIALIKNSFDQQRAQRQAANARAIADIQLQLRTETNLTVKARKALNDQIVLLREQLAVDMVDIANQQRAAELSAQRATQDAQIALMAEGAEKQREQLRVEYERQIQDINTRLETERGLTETQVAELLNQQLLLQQQYAKSLGELNDQITIDQMQAAADRTQLQLDAAREGSQEEINLRIQLLQQQRAIELAQNRQLAEDVRQSEADINANNSTVPSP